MGASPSKPRRAQVPPVVAGIRHRGRRQGGRAAPGRRRLGARLFPRAPDVPDPRPARARGRLRGPIPGRVGPKVHQHRRDEASSTSGRCSTGCTRAAEAIRTRNTAVIVEGYMDAIAAHQLGYPNVVASMGTALTERQVGLIRSAAETFVLALEPRRGRTGGDAPQPGVVVAGLRAAEGGREPPLCGVPLPGAPPRPEDRGASRRPGPGRADPRGAEGVGAPGRRSGAVPGLRHTRHGLEIRPDERRGQGPGRRDAASTGHGDEQRVRAGAPVPHAREGARRQRGGTRGERRQASADGPNAPGRRAVAGPRPVAADGRPKGRPRGVHPQVARGADRVEAARREPQPRPLSQNGEPGGIYLSARLHYNRRVARSTRRQPE